MNKLASTFVIMTMALAAMPLVSADESACASGDICCDTSTFVCSCSTTQVSPGPDRYECKDTATSLSCKSSTGPHPAAMVGSDCHIPNDILQKLIKS